LRRRWTCRLPLARPRHNAANDRRHGSTQLWFRRRIEIRFGPPLSTAGLRGRAERGDLELRLRAALEALLPAGEPILPRRRPLSFLTDLLNGEEDIRRRGSQSRR
jgi:hypothetical protein